MVTNEALIAKLERIQALVSELVAGLILPMKQQILEETTGVQEQVLDDEDDMMMTPSGDIIIGDRHHREHMSNMIHKNCEVLLATSFLSIKEVNNCSVEWEFVGGNCSGEDVIVVIDGILKMPFDPGRKKYTAIKQHHRQGGVEEEEVQKRSQKRRGSYSSRRASTGSGSRLVYERTGVG